MKFCYTPGACSLASQIREAMPWANRFELALPSQLVALRDLLDTPPAVRAEGIE